MPLVARPSYETAAAIGKPGQIVARRASVFPHGTQSYFRLNLWSLADGTKWVLVAPLSEQKPPQDWSARSVDSTSIRHYLGVNDADHLRRRRTTTSVVSA